MKPTSIIHRLVILLITLMSAISANAAKAYACYNAEKTTLTFYYDRYKALRLNTYDLNTDYNDPGWESDGTSGNVTKVVFDSSFADARPTSTFSWFYNMKDLESITGLSYLNTSEVTNMAWMFGYCKKLTSLDLGSFNTTRVTDMDYMFNGCMYLQIIYVGSGWRTNNVSSSTAMFSECWSLEGGKGTTFDIDHVDKTYAHADGGTSNPGYLTDINLPVAYACYMPSNTTLTFYYDKLRTSRDGTPYDLNKGYNNPGWYNDETALIVTKVVFHSSFADARPTSTFSWFCSMRNLETIEGLRYLNTSEVTNMVWMFGNCIRLTSLDLSQFYTAKVTDMDYMFYGCTNLQTIYVGNSWSTMDVWSSENMFYDCTSLVGGQGTTYKNSNPVDKSYAHIDGGSYYPGYFSMPPEAYACYTSSNKTLTFYYDFQRSTRPGTTYYLNTANNYTGWLKDGTYENVTKVVFDPSFAGARPKTTFDWFSGMTNLQSITGLSYLNTCEVTNMDWMFCDCEKLTSLDLSSFNTSNVTSMFGMFDGCESLQTIYVGDGWSTAAVTESDLMFDGCTKLVGGQGTTYNANHVDETYAHIDGGSNNPGYFTYKKPSGIATGIENVQRDAVKGQRDEWYTLDGRKLSGEPTKKGIYIQNGQKRIIK